MKRHSVTLVLAALACGAGLSGCTTAPANSLSKTTHSAYLESKKGQKCYVFYRMSNSGQSVTGTLKAVDEEWLVLDNVTDTALAGEGKLTTMTSEYCIPKQSIVYVSFPKN